MAVITDSTPGEISARWYCDYRGCNAKSKKVRYPTKFDAWVTAQMKLDQHRIKKHKGRVWRGISTTVDDLRNRKKRNQIRFISRKKLRRVISRSRKF